MVKAQKRLSRRKKRSKRWWKAARLLAKQHQQVRRQPRDVHHKTALWLLRQYEVVDGEDVRVASRVRNHHLAKSISDADWAAFRTILEGKAAYAVSRVVAVPPAFPSQDCSQCGTHVQKSLKVCAHLCPDCGVVLDRDESAARNVLRAGQAHRGAVGPPAMLKRASIGP